MGALYIGIILLFRVVQAVFNKRSSNEIKNIPMLVGYTSFKSAVSAVLGLLLILVLGNGFHADWRTVLIASFSGLTLFFSTFCGIYAMKSGTVSLSSMFGTAGMIIPLIAGVFLFDQPIHIIQWAGVGLFFVAAWMLIGSSKKIYTNFSFKTLLLLIGSLISNGCTMLAQQMFTAYVPDGDVSVFSFLSFGIIAILGSITFLFMKNQKSKDTEETTDSSKKTLFICGVALAIAVFVINQLATLSTTLVSPVILFTFINGGGTIISTVVAAILYKEKLSRRTVAGVVLGILSLVVIKLF